MTQEVRDEYNTLTNDAARRNGSPILYGWGGEFLLICLLFMHLSSHPGDARVFLRALHLGLWSVGMRIVAPCSLQFLEEKQEEAEEDGICLCIFFLPFSRRLHSHLPRCSQGIFGREGALASPQQFIFGELYRRSHL